MSSKSLENISNFQGWGLPQVANKKSRCKFSRTAQMFLKLVMQIKQNWKIQKLKNSFEKCWKTGTPLLQAKLKNSNPLWHVGTPSWKIGTPLAQWHAKFNNWHAFGTLARWQIYCQVDTWQLKMGSWHTFGTLARWYIST